MQARNYKYHRGDFGELPVNLNHLTIYLNFLDDCVEASNTLEMTAREKLDRIELDAKKLEIMSVELLEAPGVKIGERASADYEYLAESDRLIVKLPEPAEPETRLVVRIGARCVPLDNLLEGIYKDVTPPGAPQQYMSQCQQWGFQRIMPIFDDCTAKCSMTTTIEADAAYTHLISNGNISRKTNPDLKPIPKPGQPGRQIITYENPIPMAPYLFLVCVGTWDTLEDELTYDSGRRVRLEYLVPPGQVDGARIPMEILKQSVLWIARTQDYEYKADVYRTICMTKSNFGGMENVGNTTIVTDAALIDEHTLDQHLIYAHGVIVHEFEHNQCGSETTMETPFDVWLNEAYTVDVERQFLAQVFDPTFVRLNQVDSIRNPLLGPLAIEDSGSAGRIVRDAFNDPDELIDGVTYVKAAEVIRMLRLILGDDKFHAGKTLYFTRYKDSNANTDQFFDCFEEVSGRSLDLFKSGWLYTMGYPQLTVSSAHDSTKKEVTISFHQESQVSGTVFHVPVEVGLVDSEGRDIPGTSQVFELTAPQARLTISGVEVAPAVVSVNRGYSFYGTLDVKDADPESRALQARLDTDAFNRVEAMRRLTDIERIKLLHDPDAGISDAWLDLYGRFLRDRSIPAGLKAYFLRIEEQPMDRSYLTWRRELVVAREALMKAVNAAYRKELVDVFTEMNASVAGSSPIDGIQERILKHVTLGLIAVDDKPESHRTLIELFKNSRLVADRVAALAELNRSSAAERLGLLEEAYKEWSGHLSGYANYLRIVGAGTCEDVFDMIASEMERPTFDVNQPTWSRSLLLSMASNSKMVWTDRGIDWLADTVAWISPINAYTASRLLNTFQHYSKLRPEVKARVQVALTKVIEQVPPEVSPTVRSQAEAYLA